MNNKKGSVLSTPFVQNPPFVTPAANGAVEEEIKLTAPTKKIFDQLKKDSRLNDPSVDGWYKQSLLTTYYDNSSRYLLKQRLALRLRQQENRGCWLGLKGFGYMVDGVAKRWELEQSLTHPPNSFYSSLHYSSIESGLVKNRLEELLGSLDGGDDIDVYHFLPLMATDIFRQTRMVELGNGCRVEIALDWGKVQAGGKERTLCEVEIEKISGPLEPIHLFAADLAKRYGLKLSEQSKFSMGLALQGIGCSDGHSS
jgi:triphosphatase